MTVQQSQSVQQSDWSTSASVSLPRQSWIPENNQSIVRSSRVYPIDDQQSQQKVKRQCQPLKFCSSIPPFVRGLLLGILSGCLILAIILPVWLVKASTPRTGPTAVLRWNPTGITIAGLAGIPGTGNNELNMPVDVTLTYANDLYVADLLNHRIQKFRFGSPNGTTVAGNGTAGSSPSQLYRPSCLLVDANENLFIADTFNHRIQFWNKGSANATTIAGVTGLIGNSFNLMGYPYRIALRATPQELFVADYFNNRLMSYASGAQNGMLLLGGNGRGMNNTQLSYPVGLYFDSFSNSLIIANHAAHNIVRYVFGATSWTLVAGNIDGTPGINSTSFRYPIDVIYDPMGNMYVADRDNHRVQFFPGGGMNGITIAGISGVSGSDAITVNQPWAVRLDSQLNLYVADSRNHRIQKFLRY